MKIRKILSFVLCLAMLLAFIPAIAPTASAATTKTIYLNAGGSSLWDQADAWFQAWVWGSSTTADAWYTFIDYNIDGIYEIEVPSDATGMKIVRRGPSHTADSWDNNQKWNNTGDLTIAGNCYTITGWNEPDGEWSTVTPSSTDAVLTVAGEAGLCGVAWAPAATANDMVKNSDGLYEKVFNNVSAGTYKFKVAANHSWDKAWGGNVDSDGNTSVTVADSGSTVTVLFNVATKNITTKVVKEYAVSFNGTNVTSDGATTVVKGNTYTATLTADEGYTLPESVTVTVGGSPVTPTWDASTGSLSIANVTGDVVITAVGVEEVVIPDLEFYSASLTVEEGISINFKVKAELFTTYGYSDPAVTLVINGHEYTPAATDKGDMYVFTLYNIRPDWMGDTVTATLTATLNGNPVSDTIEYSVLAYCESMLGKTENEDLKKVLVDLLNYGAAAQKYTNYKTDALVTDSDIYIANASFGNSEAPSLTGAPTIGTGVENAAATWKGVALYLRETTRVRVSFTADSIENVTVTATVAGATYTLDSIVSAGNGKYYVFFDGLKANQMRQDVAFTVMQGDTPISNTLTCSVVSYAASAVKNGGTLADMLNALINYGDSVIAYAN